jgi:hypothetical protein
MALRSTGNKSTSEREYIVVLKVKKYETTKAKTEKNKRAF